MITKTYPIFEARWRRIDSHDMVNAFAVWQDGSRFRMDVIIGNASGKSQYRIYGAFRADEAKTGLWADHTWIQYERANQYCPGNGILCEAIWRQAERLGENEARKRFKIPPVFPVTKGAAMAAPSFAFQEKPVRIVPARSGRSYDFTDSTPSLPTLGAPDVLAKYYTPSGVGKVAGHPCKMYKDKNDFYHWWVEPKSSLVLREEIRSRQSRMPRTMTTGYEITYLRLVNRFAPDTFLPPPGSVICLPATMQDAPIPPGCRRAAMHGPRALTGLDFAVSLT